MILPGLEKMLRAFYEETTYLPTSISLPARTYDLLVVELRDVPNVRHEKRHGLFGYFDAGQIPSIELCTCNGVVRIERDDSA